MAKHGGFPMGGMGNMQQLMKQAQRMQENMQKKQAELNAQEFSASSGGGMVKVTVNGAREVLSVEIDPQCVDPDDVEMLQDLVLSAVNGALKDASSFQMRSNSCIMSENVAENFFPEAAFICRWRLKSLQGLRETWSKYRSMKSGSS